MNKESVPFDQFQRYETIARLIGFHRKSGEESFRVLELGANEHKNLKLFLPNDKILFTDIVLTENMKHDPEFQQADGVELAFADDSYDFVIATDVLEHVPAEKRGEFLTEASRVARIGAILSFPYNASFVVDAEKRVNTYYKALAGEDYIWLKEHINNTLPDISEIEKCLSSANRRFFSFKHGDIKTWEKIWYCHFDTVFAPDTLEYRERVDNYYNSVLYQSDVSNTCYRVFYVISDTNITDWEKYAVTIWRERDVESVRFLDTLLAEHRSIQRTLGKRLHKEVADKERHIENQAQIIETTQAALEEVRKEVADKEQHIENQAQIIETTQAALNNTRKEVTDKERHIENQNYIIETMRTVLEEVRREITDKERHIENQEQIIKTTKTALEEVRREVADKERHIENQTQVIEAEKTELEEEKSRSSEFNTAWLQAKTELERVAAELSQTNAELAHYKEHYFAAINQREELKANKRELEQQLESARNDYAVISNAACWKMTKPLRAFLDLLKRLPLLMLMIKALKCLKQNGFAYTWKKTKAKLRLQKQRGSLASSRVYSAEELEKQKQERFPRRVKISIIVPLYNTPEVFLKEMIQSVQGQTYADWELCMADGSDADHADVGRICRSFVRKDKRIKYRKLKENLGISGNSNACIEMASGDYIGLFDHDDLLHPAALYEVMHAICDKDADFVYTDENTFHKSPEDAYCPNFKPDFAPDTFRSYNYICHFSVFSKALLECCGGGFRSEYDGSQDYDLILRLTEKASCIVHIPKILYFWRSHEASTASSIEAKPYTLVAAKKALSEHLDRIGLKGEVLDARIPSTYRIQYELNGQPLVSILIPNKDHRVDLQKCVDSIREKSTYSNWEIIIIENNSTEQETFDYYDLLEKDERIHVVRWENEFNFSAINNFGAQHARGEHLLLLNNDVEVITSDWLEQMLMFSQRKDVGAVGAMLYYPDDTVQHAGVILGIGGVGGHAHKYFKRGDYGYMSRMAIVQNYSAVTAACLMLRREVWDQVQGLDESFKVAFNDVDFCMRIRKAGYLIVWTPFAELYHYESKSRGLEDTPEKQKRFEGEVLRFQARWAKELAAGDPYYNPNLSLEKEDFTLS